MRTVPRFSRGIGLHMPIVSSITDAVTECETAIPMTLVDDIGVIHHVKSAAARRTREVHALEAAHLRAKTQMRPGHAPGLHVTHG